MEPPDDAHSSIVERIVMRIRRNTAVKGELIEAYQCRGIGNNRTECFIPDVQVIKRKNVLLVIEVTSDPTRTVDLGKKVRAYKKHSPEYIVIDRKENRVLHYSTRRWTCKEYQFGDEMRHWLIGNVRVPSLLNPSNPESPVRRDLEQNRRTRAELRRERANHRATKERLRDLENVLSERNETIRLLTERKCDTTISVYR